MLTPFGKAMRKHRIDRGLLLKDMAEVVGLSPAFLSAVETGKKTIPPGLVDKLAGGLKLDREQREELERLAHLSAKEFKISVKAGASESDRAVAAMLARQFPGLTDDDKADIRAILERRRT